MKEKAGKDKGRSSDSQHKPTQSDRRSPEELRELAGAVARLRYRNGTSLSRREIVDRVPGVHSPEDVSRLLKIARDTGITRVVVDNGPGIGDEAAWRESDRDVVDRLRDRFGLLSARVVTLPAGLAYGPEVDDRIHLELGRAAADWLREAVRDGDEILTVGGRAPYYTALALSGRLPPNARNVRIVPVTGSIGAKTWGFERGDRQRDPGDPSSHPRVDADEASFHLARAFGQPPVLLDLPGSARQERDVKIGRERIHALITGDKQYSPSIAICGVGQLAHGHALLTGAKKFAQDPQNPVWEFHPLAPVIEILVNELIGQDDVVRADSLPYGDLANRLFALHGASESQQATLGRINSRVLGISLRELARVPIVLLCAGGPEKSQAIKYVLSLVRHGTESQGKITRLIRVLVTDSGTAEALLRDDSVLPPTDVAAVPGEG